MTTVSEAIAPASTPAGEPDGPDPAPTTEPNLADFTSEPPPAEELAATLCNLTSEYMGELSSLARPDEPENLRLAVLSLRDNITVWEGIRGHYPETWDDVERAKRILEHWYDALGYADTGDVDDAQGAIEVADGEIAELPSAGEHAELPCDG